jgi:hypothetical protein
MSLENWPPTLGRFARLLLLGAVLLGTVACSHLPEASVGYYLTKTTVRIKVVRTVACDASGRLVLAEAASPAVTHSAHRGGKREALDLAQFGYRFRDADLKFEFFDDGRLKALNATTTGQGEAALNTAIKIASVALAAAAAVPPDGKGTVVPPECQTIADASKDKPLTLTYEAEIVPSYAVGLPNTPAPAIDRVLKPIPPDIGSDFYAGKLAHAIGSVCASLEKADAPPIPVEQKKDAKGPTLLARHPGLALVRVYTSGPSCDPRPGYEIWSGELPVSQFGTDYRIPIPVSGIFGKQVVSLTFADSGALTTVQYGTTPGATQMLSVLNTGVTELQGHTAARAAQVKAEADLLAQQQRLVQCRADPATCKAE